MKACILICVAVACTGMISAAPPEAVPDAPKPDPNLGEVAAEKPVTLEKAVAKKDSWIESRYGVLGQFAQAPNIAAPVNPFAKPEAGTGRSNLSRNTVTGRIMGLRLLKFEF